MMETVRNTQCTSYELRGNAYYLLLTPYALLLTPYYLRLTTYALLLTPYAFAPISIISGFSHMVLPGLFWMAAFTIALATVVPSMAL